MKHVKTLLWKNVGLSLMWSLRRRAATHAVNVCMYVCVSVCTCGTFFAFVCLWHCTGLPHRLSDPRKDMGGRSQAYRCTQRKKKVVVCSAPEICALYMCGKIETSYVCLSMSRYVFYVFIFERRLFCLSRLHIAYAYLIKNTLKQ